MDEKRRTICVDFDGTIVDHEFPKIGALKQGVKEALGELIQKYDIVVSSCRGSKLYGNDRKYLREMEMFLTRNRVPFTRIDRGNEGKVVAVAYIDDRGIRFTTWPSAMNSLIEEGLL